MLYSVYVPIPWAGVNGNGSEKRQTDEGFLRTNGLDLESNLIKILRKGKRKIENNYKEV